MNTRLEEKTVYLNRHLNGWLVGLICFGALIAINCSYLTNPPHWDDIIGLYNQAVWLAKHHFDVVTLWKQGECGSNVYPMGILPYLYAVLYCFFPAGYIHIFGHLFNIACLAATCGFFFAVLKKYLPAWLAVIWCVAALCEPVMAGRSAALGQECPLTAAFAATIFFISAKKYRLALICMLLAFFIKLTGIFLIFAFCVWLFCLWALHGFSLDEMKKNRVVVSTAAGVCCLEIILFWICNIQNNNFFTRVSPLADKLILYFCLLIPVAGIILAAAMFSAVCGAVLFAVKRHQRKTPFDGWELSLFLLILIAGFWVAFLWYEWSLARYIAPVIFPMICLIAITLINRKLSFLAGVIIIALGVANWHGQFYRPVPAVVSRSGELLERSREYLDIIEQNQILCKTLEREHFDSPVYAKWPMVQMLSMPEMGYVSQRLPRVYSMMHVPEYAGVQGFNPDSNSADAIFIFSQDIMEITNPYILRPTDGDILLYIIGKPPAVTVVYRKAPGRIFQKAIKSKP